MLLLSALAVHSLVETAALGVQSTAKSAYLITASIGKLSRKKKSVITEGHSKNTSLRPHIRMHFELSLKECYKYLLLRKTFALALSPPSFLDPCSIVTSGLHQPAESVALLVALVKSGLSKRRIALLLGGFTLVGPLGLGCGVLAKEVIGGAVEPLLVALTAGTFFYVAATEVRHKLCRCMCVYPLGCAYIRWGVRPISARKCAVCFASEYF